MSSLQKRNYLYTRNKGKFRNVLFRLDPRQEVKQLPRFTPGFLFNCWLRQPCVYQAIELFMKINSNAELMNSPSNNFRTKTYQQYSAG